MTDTPLLSVENLSVRFEIKRGGWGKKSYLYAVDDVSFQVPKGQTLGIVGESGSGKTTAALAVARLVPAHQGVARLGEDDILSKEGEDLRRMRRRVQFIFQDPYSSLNPRKRVADIVREPLDSLSDKSEAEKKKIVDDLFEAVGLRPEQQRLFPHQFSGGQRQRIGIARALATQPELIICDEAVSALDVAVQAQILNLLRRLQAQFGLTYLFISHDLGVVQHMCDSIAVMYMGKIVEQADRLSLFNNPQHPYTRALLSAVPRVDHPGQPSRNRVLIPGDPPDPNNLPPGCRFASRCPIAKPDCSQREPLPQSIGTTHSAACHYVGTDALDAIGMAD
ncbi:ABC transporter ATP-binding protein [Aestuariivita boseongensis]|uniref:ABC transporter ATP-binding protein n=1 Tax=Aestuariivita boseongensis TaxID=1470562 RepID=UPI0006832967|nr:ABC transporter ATP-binding protein [Aestuariivita boseongensis]